MSSVRALSGGNEVSRDGNEIVQWNVDAMILHNIFGEQCFHGLSPLHILQFLHPQTGRLQNCNFPVSCMQVWTA